LVASPTNEPKEDCDDFQNLLTYVTGPDARSQTAYSVELTVFRRLLALGAVLLRLFFVVWSKNSNALFS
jgi:hypothetical protein